MDAAPSSPTRNLLDLIWAEIPEILTVIFRCCTEDDSLNWQGYTKPDGVCGNDNCCLFGLELPDLFPSCRRRQRPIDYTDFLSYSLHLGGKGQNIPPGEGNQGVAIPYLLQTGDGARVGERGQPLVTDDFEGRRNVKSVQFRKT